MHGNQNQNRVSFSSPPVLKNKIIVRHLFFLHQYWWKVSPLVLENNLSTNIRNKKCFNYSEYLDFHYDEDVFEYLFIL